MEPFNIPQVHEKRFRHLLAHLVATSRFPSPASSACCLAPGSTPVVTVNRGTFASLDVDISAAWRHGTCEQANSISAGRKRVVGGRGETASGLGVEYVYEVMFYCASAKRGLEVQQVEALLEEQRNQSKDLKEELERLEVEKDAQLQNEQQTISLLVSEKSSLAAELQRLEGVESSKAYCGRSK